MLLDEKIETAVSSLYFKEEVLIIAFKKNVIVELSHIDEIIYERAEMQHGKKVRTLVDIRYLWQADKDARAKAATPAMTDHNIALAILSDSLPTRIIGNFYMKFNKPNVPTKMFDAEDEALKWLRIFD